MACTPFRSEDGKITGFVFALEIFSLDPNGKTGVGR